MLAQGEFIAYHDSDDISHPDRITQQVQFLQLNEDYSLVGTNYEVFTDDYTQRRKSYLVRYDNNIVSCYRAGNHCVCFGSLVMRRQVVERLGGPLRSCRVLKTMSLSPAHCAGFQCAESPTPLYFYRHGQQRSRILRRAHRHLSHVVEVVKEHDQPPSAVHRLGRV